MKHAMLCRNMKSLTISIFASLLAMPPVFGQGLFDFANNQFSLTHIGSLDGPLAGPGIWGQCLAGSTTNSLLPVGEPVEHSVGGGVDGGFVAVPGASEGDPVFVQMVAWDGGLWGATLSGVPTGQLGRTDTVRVFLGYPPGPVLSPAWHQSAIVPIPEPSALGLSLLGLGVLVFRLRRRTRAGP